MRTWIKGAMAAAALALAGMSAVNARADENHDLAMKALAILGAEVPSTTHRCSSCHQLEVPLLNHWKEITEYAQWNCFYPDDPSSPVAAIDRINCMRKENKPDGEFQLQQIGMYAAGAHLPFFENLFKAAYPANEWQAKYTDFKNTVQMPYDGQNKVSQEDFDTLLKWNEAGMPYLENILGGAGDPPTSCQTEIKPELIAHIEAMKTSGWAAKNRDAGMQMFGCVNEGSPLTCLSMTDAAGKDVFPDVRATSFGVTWAQDMPQAKFRILRNLPFHTSYWMRSSADGRFVANGAYEDDDNGNWGGRVTDLNPQLTPGAAPRDIKVAAAFDPGFFPDASGFMFQGTPVSAGFCRTSILENPATTAIDFSQPECSGANNISLYQAIGASLDGSDYMAISGGFAGDGGGGSTADGVPYWGVSSYVDVVPIVNDGQKFKSLERISVFSPYLGDWGLSPSNSLTASRISGVLPDGNTAQMGYRFSFLQKTPTDDGYTAKLVDGGTICAKGGKGAFSYDERLFTTFHYVEDEDFAEMGYASAEDPAFKALREKGSSNVVIMDLAKGTFKRVTRMGPGQFALFPHFRSDGWIYYMVYDATTDQRYVAATDAGILITAEP